MINHTIMGSFMTKMNKCLWDKKVSFNKKNFPPQPSMIDLSTFRTPLALDLGSGNGNAYEPW